MTGTKPWYQSAGVWGALVTVLSSILQLFKFELDPQLLTDISNWVMALATLVGGGVALYGRLRASRRIAAAPPSGPSLNSILLLLSSSLLLALAGGCSALQHVQPPQAAYVAADRAVFESVGKEYADYYHGDPLLTLEEKERRDRTMRTWQLRIERGEKAIAATPPLVRPASTPQTPAPATQPVPDTQPADVQPPAEAVDP